MINNYMTKAPSKFLKEFINIIIETVENYNKSAPSWLSINNPRVIFLKIATNFILITKFLLGEPAPIWMLILE